MTEPLLSLERETTEPSAARQAGVKVCEALEGLGAVANAGTELVIWQRALPQRLQEWIQRLDQKQLPNLRIHVRRNGRLGQTMGPLLDDQDVPEGNMRDLLIQDLERLVSAFGQIAQTEQVDMRLEALRHDACWKFHYDSVDTRLLTTYRGPATEWVQPHFAKRALRDQKGYEGPVEQLRHHDVAVFKGSRAGPNRGILHRSPPIEGTGVTRLLLCLNKPSVIS